MGLIQSLAGTVTVELTSADIPGLLKKMNSLGITLERVCVISDLSVRCTIRRSDAQRVISAAERMAASAKLVKKQGLYWRGSSLLRRPVLLVGMAIILFVCCFLPTRVLFVAVDGNEVIPANRILEQAQTCGIRFWASRREVRSEAMKNKLLSAVPQLQWAGVNTYGCLAVISVTERTATEPQVEKPGVSSIVAATDGVIRSCTATKGNLVCKPGQAVKAGQVLVSGYTDCGISIRATRAEGEIFAETMRSITVIAPTNYVQKGQQTAVKKNYTVIIGKKQINFCKDSGISHTTCDKMYKEYYLTLPGGLRLPVALAVEQHICYERDSVSVSGENMQICAERFADSYLKEQMISGQLLKKTEAVEQLENACYLKGSYICLEMIGRVQSEEIIEHYGESD